MKILIVDDSTTLRRVLHMGIKHSLKGKDFEILEAVNGKEGLDIAKKNTDIDYIFLDVNMPVMKGDEMLEKLRALPETQHIKVIMQTTEGVREKVRSLTAMGISGYLLKPYTQDIILQLMEKLLEREAVVA